jgi:hypothetical protein
MWVVADDQRKSETGYFRRSKNPMLISHSGGGPNPVGSSEYGLLAGGVIRNRIRSAGELIELRLTVGVARLASHWRRACRRACDRTTGKWQRVEQLHARANAFGQRGFRRRARANILLDLAAQRDELIVAGAAVQ